MKLWFAALLPLILACGPAQLTPQQGAGQADGPVYGGRINVMVPVDPFDWDISYTGKTSPNSTGINLAYNRLLGFKTGPDIPYSEQVLQPELAERWEVSPDAKSFTFYLRKGVKFADLAPVNGREFTSEDVRFSVEYVTRTGEFKDKGLPKPELGWMYEGIDRVETRDEYTAVIRFKNPFVPFINYAASEWNPMMGRELYQADGHFKDRLAGTGPFQLDASDSQKGTRWVWKKNTSYWDEGKPYADELRWLVLSDQAGALAAFQTKQIDELNALANFEAEDVIKNNRQAQVLEYLQPRSPHLYLSSVPGRPTADVRVRRAISLALDRDEFMRVVSGGKGTWSMTGSVAGFFSQEETKKILRHDPELARRLLAEAGYRNGVNLEWPIVKADADITIYELIQAQVKKAGINIKLNPMAKPEQRALRKSGNFDVDIGIGSGQLNADPDSGVFASFHSKSSGNYGKVNDPDLDKLLIAQRQETDPQKRKELLRTTLLRIADQSYYPGLATLPRYNIYQPYLKNYHPHWSVEAPEAFAWVQH